MPKATRQVAPIFTFTFICVWTIEKSIRFLSTIKPFFKDKAMLIIPLTGAFSWKNLPMLTIVLILINAAVYFTVQSRDHERQEEAVKFYLTSGLADIEIERYVLYRQRAGRPLQNRPDSVDRKTAYGFESLRDEAFQLRLQNYEIIPVDDPDHERWKALRAGFDNKMDKLSSKRFGFIPADSRPYTLFSYMFMHGSFMHLLGNMIFLWLVGCVLEIGLGRIQYVSLYVLGGLCAVGLFYLFNQNSTVPLIGASGAIAGLMGAYAVAFGRTKINIFYSVGFYFNYTKVYAILLLPLWIGYEMFQLFFLTGSNVAYLAHIGGLTGGALLGLAIIKFFKRDEHKVFEEDPKSKIPDLMSQAMQKIEILAMADARPPLEEVLAIEPNHAEAWRQLFNIDKLTPASDRFHQTATKRLQLLCKQPGAEKALFDTYAEYLRLTDRPRLSADLILRLGGLFGRMGKTDEAMALIRKAVELAPGHPRLPASLLELADVCAGKQDNECRNAIVRMLVEKYPDSPEAARATGLR